MFKVKYRYLFILLLAIYSYVNILFTEGDRLFGYEINELIFFGTILIMVVAIWEGNRLLYRAVKVQEDQYRIHPLIIFFVVSVLLVTAISLIATTLLSWYFGNEAHTVLTFKLSLGFAFRVNLFLHCVNGIYYFVNRFNQAQLLAEKLKKENIESQFAALRSQVNPHFLFNSFNVLSTLVKKDPDTASKFIDQLSTVYRYLLQNQQNEVVTLKEELAFLDSYIFLLKMRFQENLKIKIDLPDAAYGTLIAPSTLQLLIENAIKHNVVSKSNPLTIKIFTDHERLVVENTIKLKEIKEESTYIGLKNIRRRYDYLYGEDAIITNSNGVFKVKIPMIEST